MTWTASAVTSGAVRIEVAPQNRMTVRSVGLATMKSIPSRISVRSCCRGRSTGARRSRRTKNRPSAESANETASIASVGPGPIVAARTPAIAGPTM